MSEKRSFRTAVEEGDPGMVGVDGSGNDPEFAPDFSPKLTDKEVERKFLKLIYNGMQGEF